MSFGCAYSVDDLLLRVIDNSLFYPCKILALQPGNKYRVLYLDDGNTEDGVSGLEVKEMNPTELAKWGGVPIKKKKDVIVAKAGDIPPGFINNLASPKRGNRNGTMFSENDENDNDSKYRLAGNEEKDDNSDSENEIIPKVIIHQKGNSHDINNENDEHNSFAGGEDGDDDGGGDPAYTIQGDQPLPRGGGLRALRALRK